MTERPPSQTIKQYVAQSGVAASTLYRQLKALREQQVTPVVPSHTLQSAGDNSAGRQHRSSGCSARPATTQIITNQASRTTDRHTLSMSANQDRSVAASGSGSQLYKPREQTSVACNLCRRHKSKCDGGRPACTRCSTRKVDCRYDHEPGEGRLIVLKRKFDTLEAQSAGALEMLESLRTAPYEDAVRLFAQIRSQDAPFTLQTSRSLQGTTTGMTSRNRELPRPTSGFEAHDTSDPVGMPAEGDTPTTVYTNPYEIAEAPPWTMAVDPYAHRSFG